MESLQQMSEKMANEFISKFESRSFSLKFIQRRHLMVRLYRITKNDIFLNPIIEGVLLEKEKIVNDIENCNNKKYVHKRSMELFKRLDKCKGIKISRRIRLFKTRKKFLFFHNIIEKLFFWKSFGIDKGKLKHHYFEGIRFLKRFAESKDFDDFFFEEDMIKYFGTQLINCAYYLKFLGVMDITKKFELRFREIFADKNDDGLSRYLYKNKVYGLTHFIITGSNYYQRYLSVKECDWILAYFKKNLKTILKRTDVDIVSEVGLCFKLCRKEPKKELDLIRKYLINHFSKKLGYIPRGKGDFNYSEHTAAIAYLFLIDFKKLYKGPNIREQVDENIG